jgi:hypothetical protein
VSKRPLLSIIIPALNEGPTIPSVLRSLARQDRISDCEVIVVDGQSVDNTRHVAMGFPFVKMLSCEPGRARQMNRGAMEANAPILWFLHADSTMPERGCVAALLHAMGQRDVCGGSFRFGLRGNDLYYRFVTVMVNFRARFLHCPYGDQGIFVRTELFHQIGGLRQIEHCEDLDLVLRLRREGRFVLLPQTVETSARTWQAHGKIATTFWHLAALSRYELRRMTGGLPELSPALVDTDPAPAPSQTAPPVASGENHPQGVSGVAEGTGAR